MSKPDPSLFTLQQLVIDLALIDRNHHLAGQERNENDIEHSFTVALLCWFIHDKYATTLNLTKILQYALTHDFVEVYAGDVNTFASAEARKQKEVDEKKSLDKLSEEFKAFPGMVTTMQNYEAQRDEEALFVWTVDKMQGLILGDMDSWRPYKKINVTYEAFLKKHSEQLAKCSPYCKEIFAVLFDYCKTTFYDRPTTKVK